ncbi:MAG: kynureninase [Flavobacteriales bacterium]|nr:kynureninase [Flavobacteriales bacterium]MCB9363321.1 kynureninase [Flavobacteriales bacterium]
MNYKNSLEFAQQQDEQDELRSYRDKFHIPVINRKETIYFTGNSLGLQPKSTLDYIKVELEDWAKWGVEGHFHGRNPWFSYHEMFAEPVAKIVGALPKEVVVMNNLTVNLNLLLVSFYRPTPTRYKIICEAKAFPSDQYALEMQVKSAGYNPDDAIIEIAPREGERTIKHDDIISAIEKAGDTLACVMIGGVNYFTGQVFDMKAITEAAHKVGANCGFDLAHGAGNIELKLHEWNVDFACWCSYKYLNSGPGGVSGVFVHERHCDNTELPRFAGWWGHDKDSRFLMEKGFQPMKSAEAWQMSNAPIITMAAHKAAIDIFEEVGMEKLLKKQKALSGYLEFIVDDINSSLTGSDKSLEIITPRNWKERGCQVSVIAHGYGKDLFNQLTNEGVISDWREPNAIRMAPVPLYNSFEDVYRFGEILKKAM